VRPHDWRAAREHRRAVVLPRFFRPTAAPSVRASHLVAVAFSAGGLEPLIRLLHVLPSDFPAAIAVAHHTGAASLLPDLLRNQTRLTVKFAEAGEALLNATVYVCPPQHHLVINPDATIGLSSHARICYARPSADWFFRTVAGSFGSRALAVILSGASADGADGLTRVAEAGGQILVQDPRTCAFGTMPQAAVATGCRCRIHAPDELGPALLATLQGLDITTARAEWEQPFGPFAA
jgi:two-component system, chemotaxis family, protein-glutamate methylesterase/glutaminase